jgi:hypothetical protein
LSLVFALQRSRELPAGLFVVTKNRASLEELPQCLLQIGYFGASHLSS